MSLAPETPTVAKPEAMLRVPVGLASPLWGLFAGAAATGAAWWWMTRWARPENLEAMLGATAKVEAEIEADVMTLAAPAIEAALEAGSSAIVEVLEAAAEAEAELVSEVAALAAPAIEAALEVAPNAIIEVLEEATAAPVVAAMFDAPAVLAVGGESAPVSQVLEAIAEADAMPEPAQEAAAPDVIEPAPVDAKPKARKSTTTKSA